jgi:hypothetical protein
MSAPLGFEAAGFPVAAGKLAEAVAQATAGADLATKRDLGEMELRLTNRIDRIVARLGLSS